MATSLLPNSWIQQMVSLSRTDQQVFEALWHYGHFNISSTWCVGFHKNYGWPLFSDSSLFSSVKFSFLFCFLIPAEKCKKICYSPPTFLSLNNVPLNYLGLKQTSYMKYFACHCLKFTIPSVCQMIFIFGLARIYVLGVHPFYLFLVCNIMFIILI